MGKRKRPQRRCQAACPYGLRSRVRQQSNGDSLIEIHMTARQPSRSSTESAVSRSKTTDVKRFVSDTALSSMRRELKAISCALHERGQKKYLLNMAWLVLLMLGVVFGWTLGSAKSQTQVVQKVSVAEPNNGIIVFKDNSWRALKPLVTIAEVEAAFGKDSWVTKIFQLVRAIQPQEVVPQDVQGVREKTTAIFTIDILEENVPVKDSWLSRFIRLPRIAWT